MLDVRDMQVSFGQAHILQGITARITERPFAIIGRNGMGKTTFCYALMGMIKAQSGEILLDKERLNGLRPDQVAERGLAIVPQGRRVFPSLTVDEHLRLVSQGPRSFWNVERVYDTFPRLAERRSNGGSQLSGGEQQMLAIARALLMNPKHIIMDEPSEGLAPVIVDHLIEVLLNLSNDGIGLILVEQNLRVATAVAESVSVMVTGRIAATVRSSVIAGDRELQQQYLGVSARAAH